MKLIKTFLYLGLGAATAAVSAQTDSIDGLNLPPPSENGTERIRIPIREGQEAIESGGTDDATNADALAFSIASQAEGWIPPDSAGILRPGMQIQVTLMIQGNVEFPPQPQRINQSGKIGLPLIQTVDVGNKDMEVVEQLLTERYEEFYRDPLVNLEFVGATNNPSLSPWGYVTMMGNVGSPGPLAMPPTRILTVSGAVKLAGGSAASANKGSIRIYRPLPEEDSVEMIRVDLDILGKKGKHAEDVRLMAGDVVYIPERIF